MDCPVCFDKFTKQAHRKPVECPYCAVKACVRCVETHITTSIDDPHCFGCRRGWTYEFLEANFPKTWFRAEFKKGREALLMDRERSRLPAAQAWAERMREAKTVLKPAADEAHREWKETCQGLKTANDEIYKLGRAHREKYKKEYEAYYRQFYMNPHYVDSGGSSDSDSDSEEESTPNASATTSFKKDKEQYLKLKKELNANLKPLNKQRSALNRQKREMYRRYNNYSGMVDTYMNSNDRVWGESQERIRIEAELRENDEAGVNDPQVREALIASLMATVKNPGEKKVFTMKCPGVDCRGFLSTQYKCGICERSACAHCLVQHSETDLDGAAHECKQEDKDSVALIKKSCRNCPSCGMSISKIEGCNQMFCTACNTAFDWSTGREIVGRQIHNPHYTEYLRRVGGSASASTPGPVELPRANCEIALTSQMLYRTYLTPYQLMLTCHYVDRKNLISRDIHRSNIHKNHIPEDIRNPATLAGQYYRLITHMRDYTITNLQNDLNVVIDNSRTNAEYICGDLTADEWKKRLLTNEFKRIVLNENLQVVQAFIAVGDDLYRAFTDTCNTLFDELPADLRAAFNVDQRYGVFVPGLVDRFKTLYEICHVRIHESISNLVQQMDMMKIIYNEKVEKLVNTYKIPCERIEEDSYDMYVLRPLTYAHLNPPKSKRIQSRKGAEEAEN